MNVTIFHNIRCGKSRGALKVLEDSGLPFAVFEYLKTPLDKDGLKNLSKKLSLAPYQMMRTKEEVFKTEYKHLKPADDNACLDALVAHPILLERPIVVIDDKAFIVRTEEAILALEKLLKK